jgi:hypothetical protein
VQGTLDLLILKTVALEPMHGWAIAQRIRQMSRDVLQVGQGALYPSLHKLEQNGWISSEWSSRQILHADQGRAQGAGAGSCAVGAPISGDLANCANGLKGEITDAVGKHSSRSIPIALLAQSR